MELDKQSLGQKVHAKKIGQILRLVCKQISKVSLCLHLLNSTYSFCSGASEIRLTPCYYKNLSIFQQINPVCFCYVLSQYYVMAVAKANLKI